MNIINIASSIMVFISILKQFRLIPSLISASIFYIYSLKLTRTSLINCIIFSLIVYIFLNVKKKHFIASVFVIFSLLFFSKQHNSISIPTQKELGQKVNAERAILINSPLTPILSNKAIVLIESVSEEYMIRLSNDLEKYNRSIYDKFAFIALLCGLIISYKYSKKLWVISVWGLFFLPFISGYLPVIMSYMIGIITVSLFRNQKHSILS